MRWDSGASGLDDAEAMLELAREASDEATCAEAATMADALESQVSAMEFQRMLSGPNDSLGALVSINSGAGGTDSQGLGGDAKPNVHTLVRTSWVQASAVGQSGPETRPASSRVPFRLKGTTPMATCERSQAFTAW